MGFVHPLNSGFDYVGLAENHRTVKSYSVTVQYVVSTAKCNRHLAHVLMQTSQNT